MDFEENSPQNPENDIIVGQICYDELDLKPIEEPKEEQNVAIEGQMGLFDMDNNQTPKIDKKSKETVVKERKQKNRNKSRNNIFKWKWGYSTQGTYIQIS